MSVYFVTGAAGFIAFKVIDLLLEQGHQVVGVDNLNNAYDPRIKAAGSLPQGLSGEMAFEGAVETAQELLEKVNASAPGAHEPDRPARCRIAIHGLCHRAERRSCIRQRRIR